MKSTQLNQVVEINLNSIDDMNIINTLVSDGWKIVHMANIKETDKGKNFKIILVRIFNDK